MIIRRLTSDHQITKLWVLSDKVLARVAALLRTKLNTLEPIYIHLPLKRLVLRLVEVQMKDLFLKPFRLMNLERGTIGLPGDDVVKAFAVSILEHSE